MHVPLSDALVAEDNAQRIVDLESDYDHLVRQLTRRGINIEELTRRAAGFRVALPFDPAFMLDQSHNVTDPIESLVTSAVELVRANVQAHLVDRTALSDCQNRNDAVMALQILKQALTTDVSPILVTARYRAGGPIDPIAVYRASGYRQQVTDERPADARRRVGIV
jgi:L-rhamnose isomerase/sugar isomerase